MLEITPSITLPASEIQIDFIRASGPGGQNVNKVSTAVQLRFDILNSPSLPQEVKERLVNLGGNRITSEGVLILEASRYRTQEQNRQDALSRLAALVQKAATPPRKRRATRPSGASRARRLREKRRKAEIKQLRRNPGDWDE